MYGHPLRAVIPSEARNLSSFSIADEEKSLVASLLGMTALTGSTTWLQTRLSPNHLALGPVTGLPMRVVTFSHSTLIRCLQWTSHRT